MGRGGYHRTKRQTLKGISVMKKHISLIISLTLLATTTIATGDILKIAALTARKCSHDFIVSNVSHGDVDASLDVAAAALDYCEAEWREFAMIEFPELSEYFALVMVKKAALNFLAYDVFYVRTKYAPCCSFQQLPSEY
jgi:hypothetical protein